MKEARGEKIKAFLTKSRVWIIWLLLSRTRLRNKMVVIVMTITIIKQRMKEARGEKIESVPNQKYSMDNKAVIKPNKVEE